MAKVTFLDRPLQGLRPVRGGLPKHILAIARDKINKKGYSPAEMTDQSQCIGCAFCATMCPDCIITVEK